MGLSFSLFAVSKSLRVAAPIRVTEVRIKNSADLLQFHRPRF
jgi:hypothetical protein